MLGDLWRFQKRPDQVSRQQSMPPKTIFVFILHQEPDLDEATQITVQRAWCHHFQSVYRVDEDHLPRPIEPTQAGSKCSCDLVEQDVYGFHVRGVVDVDKDTPGRLRAVPCGACAPLASALIVRHSIAPRDVALYAHRLSFVRAARQLRWLRGLYGAIPLDSGPAGRLSSNEAHPLASPPTQQSHRASEELCGFLARSGC